MELLEQVDAAVAELRPELLGLIEPAQEFIQASGVFAEPIYVAPDADAQTRLLALLGRES